jgi:manganese-dependent inorganic pyrophosphatase
MEASSNDNGYDMFMLLITNILDSDSEALVVGSDETKELFEKAFDKKLNDSEVKLPGVVSRKKQVVPPLTEAFEG